MDNRLAQDAADTLTGYEDQAARRARLIAASRAARAEGRYPGPRRTSTTLTTWAPPALTEQQQNEHEQYVAENNLPF